MDLDHLRNLVWYIEARAQGVPPGDPRIKSGSGVVVNLRPKGTKEPATQYLLTCVHVLRGESTDGVEGYGAPLSVIECFHPGHAGNQLWTAKVSSITPLVPENGSVPVDLRLPQRDWVLLELDDPAFQDAPTVTYWVPLPGSTQAGCLLRLLLWVFPFLDRFTVIGYPGGRASFSATGIVQSTPSPRPLPMHIIPADGLLNLTGSESRPGMSGGGVFALDGTLRGIHRSRTDAELRLGGISAAYIRRELSERGFEPVEEGKKKPIPFPWAWAAVAIVLGLLFALWPRPVRKLEIEVFAKDRNSSATYYAQGLEVGFAADGWKPKKVKTGITDINGKTEIYVYLRFGTKTESLPGYLIVGSKVPAHLSNDGPLIIKPFGRSGPTSADIKRLDIAQTRLAESLEVMPLSRWQNDLASALFADLRAGNPQTIALTQFHTNFSDFGLTRLKLEEIVTQWVEDLKLERPVLREEELATHFDESRTAQIKDALKSVGYIQTLDSTVDRPFVGTGFVVGRNLVLTADYVLERGQQFITFSENVESSNTGHFLREVLWRDKARKICLVAVDGNLPPPLTLRSSSEVGGNTSQELLVIGYIGRGPDTRLPQEVQSWFGQFVNQRFIMPGASILGSSKPSPNAESSPIHYVFHDASTSSGTGGAPVLSNKSMSVVSVQIEGFWGGTRKESSGPLLSQLLDEDDEFRSIIESHGGRIQSYVEPGNHTQVPPQEAQVGITIPYDPDFLGAHVPLPSFTGSGTNEDTQPALLDYIHYSVMMNNERGMARYTASNIDRSQLISFQRPMDKWLKDPRLPDALQIDNVVYSRNDWDRGHLTRPRSIAWGDETIAMAAYRSGFFMTNAIPQQSVFNRMVWSQWEDYALRALYPDSKRLSLFIGPVFAASDPDYRGKRIPQQIWAVAVVQNPADPTRPLVHSYLARQFELGEGNSILPLSSRQSPAELEVNLSEIEALTGLKFSIPGKP